MATQGQREALEAFDRALGQEAHSLQRWPELLWQQLHNRLQWEKDAVPEVLAAQLERRTAPGARPWVRTRTPPRESTGLVRSLRGSEGGARFGGHSGTAPCAVSPDGAYVVLGGWALQLWDPATGEERTLDSPAMSMINDCAVSPDGSYIVSAGGRTLKLWDPLTGACLRTWEGHASSCAVSPDGAYVVSLGEGGSSDETTLRLWDPDTGECLQIFQAAPSESGCAVSPDGAYLVTARGDRLMLWDPATGEKLRALEGHTDVRYGAVAPDGSYVVSASGDKTLKLWDPGSGTCLRTLRGHTAAVSACAVSPDGTYLVSASVDKTLKLWDPDSGTCLQTLRGHTSPVIACAVSPDGSFVVSSGDDAVMLWDPFVGQELRSPDGDAEEVAISERHTGEVLDCVVSPDGAYVVSASADNTLKLWDSSMGACLRTLEGHTVRIVKGVNTCAVSPDGAYVASAGQDETVKLWDPATGEELRTLTGTGGGSCAIGPGGAYLVSRRGRGMVKAWDPATGEELHTLRGRELTAQSNEDDQFFRCLSGPDRVYALSVSTHTYSDDKTLRLWDAATGKELWAIENRDRLAAYALSPDGARLVTMGKGLLELLDMATGETELRTLESRHTADIEGGEPEWVSPDGAYLVARRLHVETLDLWELASGRSVVSIPLHGLSAVALHPWLPLVACGDAGGAVYLVEIVGVDYGPIVVTAIDPGNGPTIRCPACWHEHPLDKGWLGEALDCPTLDCALRLRVNPFIVKARRKRRRFWARLIADARSNARARS